MATQSAHSTTVTDPMPKADYPFYIAPHPGNRFSSLQKVVIFLRTIVFYIGYGPTLAIFCSAMVLIRPFVPYRLYYYLCTRWPLWLVRVWCWYICGIRYEIRGLENLPEQPAILYSKHQSAWETFLLQTLCMPQSTVLKRELIWIPLFGWALGLMKPISINRSKKRSAMHQVLENGTRRLDEGNWVLIFPEGTRVRPGMSRPYSMGGVRLALHSGRPIVPIALNSLNCWPAGDYMKYPGTIMIDIGKPISVEGKTPEQLLLEARGWIEHHYEQMQGVSR